MIGKAKSIAHVGAAIDYAMKKEKAVELVKGKVIGDTGQEIAQEFRMFQKLNANCQNNALSVVLSPAIEDGKQLGNKELRQITSSYLEKMGLQDHQYAAYVHNDKAHKHIHLFINRINAQGGAANDSYISKRSQRVADEIAQERGITRAKEVQQRKEQALKPLKAKVKSVHLEVMKSYPVSFEGYSKAMQAKGVNIEPSVNKQGHRQGFRVGLEGVSLKASEVWRGMSLNKLEPMFEKALAHENQKSQSNQIRPDRGGISR